METNDKKLPVIATMTDEERKGLNEVSERLGALDRTTITMMRALQESHAEKRLTLLTSKREQWAAIEKRYNLDPRKSYEVVQSTGEIVEHVCAIHDGLPHPMAVIDLTSLFRQAPAAAEPDAPPAAPVPPKTTH